MMRKMIKADSLLIYFLVSLLFMDITFRYRTSSEELFSINLLISFVFLLSLTILFFLATSFFHHKASFLLSTLFLLLAFIIYASQYIYYTIFKTYYSIYSAENGAQVFEFWRDIVSIIWKHSVMLLLFFLPVLLFIIFGRKLLTFEKLDWLNRLSLGICLVLAQLTGLGAVYAGGKDLNSAYDLYYKNSYPLLSVERLGLITTMRLDLQRQLMGWSPAIEVSAPEPLAPAPTDSTKPQGKDEKNPPNPNPEQKEEKPEYNTMEINFDDLIAQENNTTIRNMHQYFRNVTPTEKNEFTGKYKGYNLILITAEGFSPYAVHKDVTPTLYKMVNEGYRFTNFYTPIWGVSTSDGEYVACTGLIPKSGIWSFQESGKNALPFVMGNQLKKLNYKTLAYHNHTYTYYGRDKSHPNMGYVYKGVGNGLHVKETWPESDLEMMEKTVPEYINNQPFHTYYMTVSGHLQYTFTGNYIAWKNKKYVENLSYSEQAKAFMATQIELDRALQYLLAQLEGAGIADKTLIALSADHYPYGLENKTISELAGHHVEENFELYKSTFILYTKGMEPMEVSEPASSLDILPTISNLLGLEYDSRLLMGRDIFSNSTPLVLFNNKSFITDKGRYNSITRKFTTNEGVKIEDDYVKNISSTIQNKFHYSAKILEMDYYRKLFQD